MAYQRMSHMVLSLFYCLAMSSAAASDTLATTVPSSQGGVFAAPEKFQHESMQTRLHKLTLTPLTKAQALYAQAEIQASQGLVERGRISFIAAEQLAPGLPFAKPEAVAKLRTQLNLTANSSSLGGQARRPMINMSLIDAVTWGCFAFIGAALMGFVIMRRNTNALLTSNRSRSTAYAASFAPRKPSPFSPQTAPSAQSKAAQSPPADDAQDTSPTPL